MAPLNGTGPLNPDWLDGGTAQAVPLGLLEDVKGELEVFVWMEKVDWVELVQVIAG